MGKQDDGQVWMVVGALGSISLAVLLIPLRALTSASNLAFVFLAFTIVVAELGGRSAALVTALASGMSLNFFLTQPYLSLTIEKWDDVIAFLRPARVWAHCRVVRETESAGVRGRESSANRTGRAAEGCQPISGWSPTR